MSKISNLFSVKIIEKVINETFSNEKRMYYKIYMSSYIFEGTYDLVLNFLDGRTIEVFVFESEKDSFLVKIPIIQTILYVDFLKSKKMPNKNKFILKLMNSNQSISFFSELSFKDCVIEDVMFLMIFNQLFKDKLSYFKRNEELFVGEDSFSNQELITIEKMETLKLFINRLMEFIEMNNQPIVYKNNHLVEDNKKQDMLELIYLNSFEFLFSEDNKEKYKNIYINFEQVEKDKYEYDAVNIAGLEIENFSLLLEFVEIINDESLKCDLLDFISFHSN